jgi:flagellar biosynthetic protein FlhB
MAEGEDSAQEKSHEATPRRLERAREQGDVPRSQDAQTFAAYLGLALAAAIALPWASRRLGETLMAPLAHPHDMAHGLMTGGADELLSALMVRVLLPALPFVAAPALLVIALLLAQRGIVLAPDKAMPKLSRLSPIANARQKYGPDGLVEFAKSAVKLTAVGAVLGIVIAGEVDRLGSYVARPPGALGALLAEQFEALIIGVLIVTAVVGFFDLLWQQAEHLRRNRMTHQDLKEEGKQAEGDPHMKAERRERARAMANNRMLLDVPESTVVITNPTHYAVALKWDRAPGTAPLCLAKGVDEMAHRIREIAECHDVPVHRDPPTARALHALVEVGQEVPPEHYRAVAAAILFAERMRAEARR